MSSNTEQCVDTSGGGAFPLATPIGWDGRIADDLLITFEPLSGGITEAARVEICRWTQTWLTRHPGAVVVMGCNGKSRNSARGVRESRLQTLGRALTDSGVSEERVRYTDEVIELNAASSPIPEHRGILCIKVLRSAVLDSSVMPISEMFRSNLPVAGVHEQPRG